MKETKKGWLTKMIKRICGCDMYINEDGKVAFFAENGKYLYKWDKKAALLQ